MTARYPTLFEDNKIRIVLKCVVVALLLVLAVPTMMLNWSNWDDVIQGIVSGRFSSKYRFDLIYSGGAFDQGGLTKLVILIFAMELLTLLCYALSVLISRSRWWRVVCIAMTLVFFIAPVGMNLLYSWELARYIAVMGITPKRIEGALLSILFLFVPMACLAGCFIGVKSAKRIIYAAFWCMLAAGIVFMAVNAAACKSISCHPLPTNIYP
jgi:hypothetical protein